jgi:hypothetical protein|tara:strand:+ start:615 stop:1001 length:387 start_codon:yes stop_codon:yes gene_type:complete
MPRKTFSLKDIQFLADYYSQFGAPETWALFQTIHSFYTPGQNPNDREPIDALEILKALEKLGLSPETQEQSLTWLSSLRKKLNRELFNIISQQGNPAELIIGVDYKFTQILKSSELQRATIIPRQKMI